MDTLAPADGSGRSYDCHRCTRKGVVARPSLIAEEYASRRRGSGWESDAVRTASVGASLPGHGQDRSITWRVMVIMIRSSLHLGTVRLRASTAPHGRTPQILSAQLLHSTLASLLSMCVLLRLEGIFMSVSLVCLSSRLRLFNVVTKAHMHFEREVLRAPAKRTKHITPS